MKTHFAGLDIGGSTIKCMLVDAAGEAAGPIVEVKSYVKDGRDLAVSIEASSIRLSCML